MTAVVDGRGRAVQLTLAPGQRNDTIAVVDIVRRIGTRYDMLDVTFFAFFDARSRPPLV